MSFREIGPALARGTVDAGILIHELQLNPEAAGFRKIGDLGKLWWERFITCRYRLGPMPSTAALVRTPPERSPASSKPASRPASPDRAATARWQLPCHGRSRKADLDVASGDRYISMYVNHRSLAMAEDVRACHRPALRRRCDRGPVPDGRVRQPPFTIPEPLITD